MNRDIKEPNGIFIYQSYMNLGLNHEEVVILAYLVDTYKINQRQPICRSIKHIADSLGKSLKNTKKELSNLKEMGFIQFTCDGDNITYTPAKDRIPHIKEEIPNKKEIEKMNKEMCEEYEKMLRQQQ